MGSPIPGLIAGLIGVKLTREYRALREIRQYCEDNDIPYDDVVAREVVKGYTSGPVDIHEVISHYKSLTGSKNERKIDEEWTYYNKHEIWKKKE